MGEQESVHMEDWNVVIKDKNREISLKSQNSSISRSVMH